MKYDENISINGFTLENIVETLTGVILIGIALYSSDPIIDAKDPFVFDPQLIMVWLFVLIFSYKGAAMIVAANRDQKQRYKNLKEENNEI